jgi:DNA end-binding protein Ku
VPEVDTASEQPVGRPIWSGTVTFGLVSVPVVLYSANRGRPVGLHMVTTEGTQLARRYFTEKGEKPLDDDDIVRGYEIDKGKYVLLEDEDLERLAPERTRDIDLKVFVDINELDPIYFERAYYMTPGDGGSKAYRLLARVMEETERAGIATFVMRAKEYLVAIIAENGVLRAETLRFADELRTAEDIGLPEAPKITAADLKKVHAQIKRLAKAHLDPTELADESAEKLIKLAEKKARKGGEVVHPAEPVEEESESESAEVIDLMERLKRSLASGSASGRSHSRARAVGKKTTRRRRTPA